MTAPENPPTKKRTIRRREGGIPDALMPTKVPGGAAGAQKRTNEARSPPLSAGGRTDAPDLPDRTGPPPPP